MKYVNIALLFLLAGLVSSCGSSATLRSIVIAPNPASTTSSPQGTVQFAATGEMSNKTARALTASNGLIWASSSTTVSTIDSNGVATCLASGSVTITATAPNNLKKGSTATAVSGTATLNCM